MSRSLTRIVTLFTKDFKDAVRDARVLIALVVPLGIGIFYSFGFDDESVSTVHARVAIASSGDTRLLEFVESALPENVVVEVREAADQAEVERLVGEDEAAVGLIVPAIVAGHHAIRIVRVVLVRDRPHHRHLVEPLRQQRQMLADADAGQHGRDGAELAANAFGCVGLRVEGVDMADAAEHKE